jgi:hypothetical protein
MNAVTKAEPQELATVADYGANLIEVIARAARDPSVDIDKMERLIAMQERVQSRAAELAFSSAFADMQPELPSITKGNQIVHKGQVISDYADWASISKVVTPILSSHGFSLSFKPGNAGGQVTVTAIVRHREGHQDEATLSLPLDTSGAKNAVQAVGSTIMYGRRYTACPLLNIVTEGEDDDGSASGPKIQHEAPRDMPFPQGPARNKQELKTTGRELWRDIEGVGDIASLNDLLEKGGPLIEQMKQALPSWWTGGQRDGDSFEGLEHVIARVRRDCLASDLPEYIQRGADILAAG